ncbi:hypothetical protein ACWT_8088 [Actinoplanes sp. SE50]|uniref:hypothetical protein n=1 Tax=unclassified Actinoplanes TaxID=2626549 RepID=UPI00023EDCF7|nr:MULTISPECIES: hypothetical protein [unclassified Actinoplanes]AEV89097.1 hypothetical protein ACPL_8219 [Actinoplanes sp. SE50/110]ATO87503.1 hypothetical protein ACWT_8088 [Actinoplanes sp. SE50]SLM04921.1 hypothetical protein ACSP50_8233 [Actinoplanes sp. SE50/110]
MHRVLTASLIAALGVSLAGSPAEAAALGGSPAQAAKPLDVVKKAVAARIDKRLDALRKDAAALGGAKHLQAAHKQALQQLIDGQSAGLTALKSKVEGETTAAGLKADARSMVVDYRVFMLTGPKVRLSVAIDAELAAADRLHDRPGADDAKLDAVQKSLAGKVDALLAIQPGADGAAVRAQVTTIRTTAKGARSDLKAISGKK